MKRWWISWYQAPDTGFELHSPWWTTGWDPNDRRTVCAAIIAPDEDAAVELVKAGQDEPGNVEWRFIEERDDNWSPFASGRFPRADWMQWPDD